MTHMFRHGSSICNSLGEGGAHEQAARAPRGHQQVYDMTAKSGFKNELSQALSELAMRIRIIPGCEGVDIYRHLDQAGQFLFLEHWTSPEQHTKVGVALGKAAFSRGLGLLARPPTDRVLEPSMRQTS